jgi:hypothetical protein
MRVETVSLTDKLPTPQDINRRIEACQEELAALRKLLRVSVTAHKADEARRARCAAPAKEVRP